MQYQFALFKVIDLCVIENSIVLTTIRQLPEKFEQKTLNFYTRYVILHQQ